MMNRFSKIVLMVSACSLMGVPFAMAAPELFFYPAQSWSAQTAQSGDSYGDDLDCAVQTTFNNGFVVRVDGGSRAVESLNIDFRQNAFEGGKAYQARLSVPGQFAQDLSAKALDSSRLRIDVLQNKDFYTYLRRAGVFDLSVEGNDFRFYLTGFAAAAQGFEACMAKAKPQEEIVVQRHHDTVIVPVEDETLNEAMNFEQAEMAVAGESDDSGTSGVPLELVVPEPEPADIHVVDGHDSVSAMPDERSQARESTEDGSWFSRLFSHEERVEQVAEAAAQDKDREQITLIEELEEFVGGPPAAADTTMPEEPADLPVAQVDEIEAPEAPPVSEVLRSPEMVVHKQTRQMEVDLRDTGAPMPHCDMSELSGMQAALAQLRSDNVDLQRRLDASNDALVNAVEEAKGLKASHETIVGTRSDIEHVASELNRENARLSRELSSAQAALARAESHLNLAAQEPSAGIDGDVAALQSTVRKLKTENAALSAELDAALKAERTEQVSIASDNWNLERVTLLYDESERQLKSLGQQLQRERTQCAMEKKDLEVMLFDPEVTSQAQLAELAKLESDLAAAKAELARMKSGLAR